MDNRYLATAAADYFAAANYRGALASSYYPEYAAHAALGNGYLTDPTGRIPTISSYDQVQQRKGRLKLSFSY